MRVPVPMLPAREPLTLQTTLASISCCTPPFPSSFSSSSSCCFPPSHYSPTTLAARQKPKCCRYGLGPSCTSGSLTSLPLSSNSPLPLSTPSHCLSPPPPALPSVAVTRHEIDLFLFCVKCRAQNSPKKKTEKKTENFSFLRLLV